MPTDTEETGRRPGLPIGLGRWLKLAGVAALLLLLSEGLWLWQTWPVRELLQSPGLATPLAVGR